MAMKKSTKNRKAFSLAEAMMATVVLGIAAAGVLLPFVSGAAVQAEGAHRTLAAKLASDLMEQFINTPFEELVTDGGGYVDEPQGQIKDVNGVLFSDPAYANFSRGASYEYDASQPFFIIVTVWVKYNGNEIVSLSRLISK
jgi:type II secretory pathway pseudopilin PulG